VKKNNTKHFRTQLTHPKTVSPTPGDRVSIQKEGSNRERFGPTGRHLSSQKKRKTALKKDRNKKRGKTMLGGATIAGFQWPGKNKGYGGGWLEL